MASASELEKEYASLSADVPSVAVQVEGAPASSPISAGRKKALITAAAIFVVSFAVLYTMKLFKKKDEEDEEDEEPKESADLIKTTLAATLITALAVFGLVKAKKLHL